MRRLRPYEGMTLIEVLLVIALIAVLAAITYIAINPAKNFQDARNAQRSSDVLQILNAVTQYSSEQGHALTDFTVAIPACPDTANIGTGTGDVNLASLLVEEYIVGIPSDPLTGTATDTGYDICRTATNRAQVSATREGTGLPIVVKR